MDELQQFGAEQEYGWITTIWSRTRISMNYNNLEQNKNMDELQQFGAAQEYGWITTRSELYTGSQKKKTGRWELQRNHATRRARFRPGKNTLRK